MRTRIGSVVAMSMFAALSAMAQSTGSIDTSTGDIDRSGTFGSINSSPGSAGKTVQNTMTGQQPQTSAETTVPEQPKPKLESTVIYGSDGAVLAGSVLAPSTQPATRPTTQPMGEVH